MLKTFQKLLHWNNSAHRAIAAFLISVAFLLLVNFKLATILRNDVDTSVEKSNVLGQEIDDLERKLGVVTKLYEEELEKPQTEIESIATSASLVNFSIEPNTIKSLHIIDESILSEDILNGTLENSDFTDNSVGSTNIIDNSVNTEDISDEAITSTKLGDNSVDGAKISVAGEETGDLLIHNDGEWLRLSIGDNDEILAVQNGLPTWLATSSVSSFNLSADSGFSQLINSNDTLLVSGGSNGIDTISSNPETLTISFDSTEVGSTTWGTGPSNWIFESGAADPQLKFTSGSLQIIADTTNSGGLTVAGLTLLENNLKISGSALFQNTSPTDDMLSMSITSGGINPFVGTLTLNDLTDHRTWSLPDRSGSFLISGSGNLDFSDLANSLSLDSSTSISFGGSDNNLTFTNNSTGDEIHNLTSTGDFLVQSVGINLFEVSDDSKINLGSTLTNFSASLSSATNTQTAFTINTPMLANNSGEVGKSLEMIGPLGAEIFSVGRQNEGELDFARVSVGGDLSRDQFFVNGRINSSWNHLWADFLSYTVLTTADASMNFGLLFDEATGTSGQVQSIFNSGVSGAIRLSNPTSPTAGENEWISTGGISITQLSLNPVLEVRMQASSNSDHRAMVGFTNLALNNSYGSDNIQSGAFDGAYFRKDTIKSTWTAVTRSGVSETTTPGLGDTSIFQNLRIEMDNATSSVKFFIDGNIVATHSTDVPAASTGLGFNLGNAITSTNNRFVTIDFIRIWSDDPPQMNKILANIEDNVLDENIPHNFEDDQTTDELVASLESNSSNLFSNLFDGAIEMLDRLVFNFDVLFKSMVTLAGEIKILGESSFTGSASFEGKVKLPANTAGKVSMEAGDLTTSVKFAFPHSEAPSVVVTPLQSIVGNYFVTDISGEGFTLNMLEPQASKLEFNYLAIESNSSEKIDHVITDKEITK